MSIKDQGHSLTFAKVHPGYKIKTLFFFSETVGPFKTKFHMKTYGNTGVKIYLNVLYDKTNMAVLPIFDKK